jgi:membrane protein
MKPRNSLLLLKETFAAWSADKAPRLGAALAYYTIFSIAPLLIIAITIIGLFFSNAQKQLFEKAESVLGTRGADVLQSMISAAQQPTTSFIATALAIVTVLFGAAGIFIALRDALNVIWKVKKPANKGLWGFVSNYVRAISMVFALGFVLLIDLAIAAALAFIGERIANLFPGANILMKALAFVVSIGISMCLFAIIFKVLPDAKIAWHDVWIGAAFTAVLFAIAKFGLGFYLAHAAAKSAYGAAGAMVLVLLWVYYSAQLLFLGAEFTQVYARHHGSHSKKLSAARTEKQRLIAQSELFRKKLQETLNVGDFVRHKAPSRF